MPFRVWSGDLPSCPYLMYFRPSRRYLLLFFGRRLFSRAWSTDDLSPHVLAAAWLLPFGYLLGSHPPLLIPGGPEPSWVGASTCSCFSCASATIPRTRRAYTAESGAAVTPCSSTLSTTVNATTASISPRPGSSGASSTTIRPSTMEARPRGPNQPAKRTETPRRCVPIRESAKGSIRIRVRLSRV